MAKLTELQTTIRSAGRCAREGLKRHEIGGNQTAIWLLQLAISDLQAAINIIEEEKNE